MGTQETKITGVAGVFVNTSGKNARITLSLEVDDNYISKASLTLWENDEKEKVLEVLKTLGFVGDAEDLADSQRRDWNPLFPKVAQHGVTAVLNSSEKDGKTYYNVVQVENVTLGTTNKIDKTKFVQSFGYIKGEAPSSTSDEVNKTPF